VPTENRVSIEEITGESLLEPSETVTISDHVDKIVVLNIWGAWCGACRAEAADLEQAYAETSALGVVFIGINVRDNDRSYAEDFLRDRKITYPSIYDPSMRTLSTLGEYRNLAVPSTLILDRKHRVAAAFVGAVTRTDLLRKIAVLAEQE
jgi:thiol-disulfide isomerase/thioredoxin